MGLVDLVFPRLCVSCNRRGRYVCVECLNKLHIKKEQICSMCTKRSIDGMTHARCGRKQGLDGLTVVFEYHGLVRKLIGKLKYGLVTDLKNDLLELIATFGDFKVVSKHSWLVVSVPLYVGRQRKRGFNQAEILGEMIANYFGWRFLPKALVRSRETKQQMGLKKEDRLMNVRGAFRLVDGMKEDLRGKKVLLIDDVWTTGATMRECGKMLKRVGTKVVWGMTLAA